MSENSRSTASGAHSVTAQGDAQRESAVVEERRERRGLFGRKNRDRGVEDLKDRDVSGEARVIPADERQTTGERHVEEYRDLSQHPEDRRRSLLNDDDEGPATQRHEAIHESAVAVPVATPAEREPVTSDTAIYDRQVLNDGINDERDREAEREARQRALGVRTRSDEPVEAYEPVAHRRTTDRWHGSLALLLLRLITGGILGVHAYQHLWHLARTQDYYSHSILPHWNFLGVTVFAIEALTALFLIFGLLTRFAGLLLLAFEIATLALFVWGKVSPFSANRVGFNGELELMLAAAGFLFLLLGSGGLGLDASFRHGRQTRREERALGNRV